MSIWKCIKFLFLFTLLPVLSFSQKKTILTRQECEAIFLDNNISLIVEQLNISQAEANIAQAKIWPNPTLEIDEVNLWATQKQRDVLSDELPPLSGNDFGKYQQIAVSLEQVIITAGKRKKLIALEEVSLEKSRQYFEDLLRSLKIEFRNLMTQLQYLQNGIAVYQTQVSSMQQLTRAYKNQVDQENVPLGEYIRLKAMELEILKDLNDLHIEKNEVEKELKLLMRMGGEVELEITGEGFIKNPNTFNTPQLAELLIEAKEYRPDFKIAHFDKTFSQHLYAYEKAQRTPNLTLKGSYDRGGNILYNFVGFGLAIDLPLFDRNQGNIKSAQIGMMQADLQLEEKEIDLENEVFLAYQNLFNAIDFFEKIESDYEETLDKLLTSYTKNFTDRNISLLEYLDFLEAYLENKMIILDAGKELNQKVEELNFTIGRDMIE